MILNTGFKLFPGELGGEGLQGEGGGAVHRGRRVRLPDEGRALVAVGSRTPKVLGLGLRGRAALPAQLREAAKGVRAHLGFGAEDVEEPVSVDGHRASAASPRTARGAGGICGTDPYERAAHSYGKSYSDIVRAFRGRFDHPCDVVAFPRDERRHRLAAGVVRRRGAAAIPYGGGTSVVGGVEAAVGDGYAGAVSIDLRRLDRVLDVDVTSRAARIQAGANGPGSRSSCASTA